MGQVTEINRRGLLKSGSHGLAILGCVVGAGVPRDAYAQSTALQKVNIVTTSGSASRVMNALMKRLGYLEQFGVQAEVVTVADGARAMAVLLSGHGDICVGTGFGQVLPAIERGGQLKVLAGATLLPLTAILSAKPEIKTVHDLVGKTLGSGSVGSLEYQLVAALLEKKGVDISKVTFLNVGGTPDIFRAVVNGTVDAGTCTVDVYEQRAKYKVHALDDGLMWKELPEFTNQATYSSDAAIASKRDALVRTLAAYAKLYRYISSPESKDVYVAAQDAALGMKDPTQATGEWNFFQQFKPFAVDLVLSEARIRYTQQLNLAAGIQKKMLPFDQVADMSLARDAVKYLG